MTDGISLRGTSFSLSPDPQGKTGSAGLKDAAGKFEALMISQMLKSARQSDSGGWTGEEDQSSSSIMDMAEQHLGELLGSQGSFGLARMVVSQLGDKD